MNIGKAIIIAAIVVLGIIVIPLAALVLATIWPLALSVFILLFPLIAIGIAIGGIISRKK